MHRFILNESAAPGRVLALDEDERNHALRVLRMENGDEAEAADAAGNLFRVRLVTGGPDASLEILEAVEAREAPVDVTLYQGFPKFDKLEFTVQKATELGVKRIEPVFMARCVVKLDRRECAKRMERVTKIAREAVKQCGRNLCPEIGTGISVKEMPKHELMLLPWEDARGVRIRDVYRAHPEAKDIAVIIGPEGGISPEEVEGMKALGAIPVTLGPRILRTETASVAAVTEVMTLWGDL